MIAIDLGTTNSLVAVWTPEGPELILNPLKESLTPSVIGFDEDDTMLVGQVAAERLMTHPEQTIADFKRLMGSESQIKLGKQTFRPEELSSFVLRFLKEDAEAHLGHPVTDAVISVPAYFNDVQRKAVINAGKLAGLKVERVINEPTAAALAYGLGEVEEGEFLVFDLGGGTFDVSILDKYDNVMEVRASAGDNFLGGNDFRTLIEDYLLEQGEIERAELSPSERNALLKEAERLKVALSGSASVQSSLVLGERAALETELTRDVFEERSQTLLRRLRVPLERAIKDAVIQPDKIDNIILVGGATRMPMIRKLVTRLFGKLPLSHLDPDTLVAQGAAVQAGLKMRDCALEDVVMTDVCPYTLGTEVLDERVNGQRELIMSPIIERNAIVPISRSRTYTTSSDNQKKVQISVYQGENLRPQNNICLGSLEVTVPRAPAGEESVEVRFTYDVNGALEVEVEVLSTKIREKRVFSNNALLSPEELEERFEKLGKIKLHPRDQVENRTLLSRAERIYAESLGDKREYLLNVLRQFEAALDDQSNRNIEQDRIAFSEILDQLEHSVFDPDM